MLTLRSPKLDDRAVPSLTDDEMRRLIKACDGPALQDKRDKAMVVLFAETGLRASELLDLDMSDIDLAGCVLLVRRGKGGKGRRVSFSVSCATVLDRIYEHAAVIPDRCGSDSAARSVYEGMASALKARAKLAGVTGFHVHRLRHTSAVRWLAAGGTETGLMAQSGWRSRQMIDRYIKTASEELAAKEFGRLDLGLGDL